MEMDPQIEYPGLAPPRPVAQPAPGDAEVISSELEAEMKRLAWSKGDFRFIPYGAFWADMIYATARTRPGAYTFYVFSPEVHGESAFVIDARRTRFGFDVEGPAIPLLRRCFVSPF